MACINFDQQQSLIMTGPISQLLFLRLNQLRLLGRCWKIIRLIKLQKKKKKIYKHLNFSSRGVYFTSIKKNQLVRKSTPVTYAYLTCYVSRSILKFWNYMYHLRMFYANEYWNSGKKNTVSLLTSIVKHWPHSTTLKGGKICRTTSKRDYEWAQTGGHLHINLQCCVDQFFPSSTGQTYGALR